MERPDSPSTARSDSRCPGRMIEQGHCHKEPGGGLHLPWAEESEEVRPERAVESTGDMDELGLITCCWLAETLVALREARRGVGR